LRRKHAKQTISFIQYQQLHKSWKSPYHTITITYHTCCSSISSSTASLSSFFIRFPISIASRCFLNESEFHKWITVQFDNSYKTLYALLCLQSHQRTLWRWWRAPLVIFIFFICQCCEPRDQVLEDINESLGLAYSSWSYVQT